jgi:UDP-N-acetylmuramoyl-tripeptide--D-alanyl-D-alanine ligase
VRITQCELRSDLTTRVVLEVEGRRLEFSSILPGFSGALAAAAATAVTLGLGLTGLDGQSLEQALTHAGVPGRATVIQLSEDRLLVDDSYNSNPASVRMAIALGQALRRQTGGRLLLVLGDMLELGEHAEQAHRDMGQWAVESEAAELWCVGTLATITHREASKRAEQVDSSMKCRHFLKAGEVGDQLLPGFLPRDVVVVKASRGLRAEEIVRYLQDSKLASPPGEGAHES